MAWGALTAIVPSRPTPTHTLTHPPRISLIFPYNSVSLITSWHPSQGCTWLIAMRLGGFNNWGEDNDRGKTCFLSVEASVRELHQST